MRACCMIRANPHYRREAFESGLRNIGADIVQTAPAQPGPDDVLIIWNRYGHYEAEARRYEAAGGQVIVVENGYIGKDHNGLQLYAMALSQHNGAGWFPVGEAERWKQQHITLHPPRTGGKEIVILPSRGIGPQGVAQPRDFEQRARLKLQGCGYPVRVRAHPGQKLAEPLARDLRDAAAVVTWASGAAIKALALGIPVYYAFEKWIAAAACHLGFNVNHPVPVEEALRYHSFHRIGWAQWSVEEIACGEPFNVLLSAAVQTPRAAYM